MFSTVADIQSGVSLACMTPKEEKQNRELRERLAARKLHFPSCGHLYAAFERSRDALLAEAMRHCPEAKVINFGPDLDQRSGSWTAIVKVNSDDSKRGFLGNDVLMRRLSNAASAGGFAPEEIAIESEETVQRDYKGNWFFRLKA
jgi:hypothetical protein